MPDIPLGPLPHHVEGPGDRTWRPYEEIVNLARGLMLFGAEAHSAGNTKKGLLAMSQAQALMYALDMQSTDPISDYLLPPEMFILFERLTKRGAEWYAEQVQKGEQAKLDAHSKRSLN